MASFLLHKNTMHLSSSPHVPHAPPSSCSLVWSPKQYLVGITNNESPYYAFACSLLLPCPFQSIFCSRNTGGYRDLEKNRICNLSKALCSMQVTDVPFHILSSSVTVGSKKKVRRIKTSKKKLTLWYMKRLIMKQSNYQIFMHLSICFKISTRDEKWWLFRT